MVNGRNINMYEGVVENSIIFALLIQTEKLENSEVDKQCMLFYPVSGLFFTLTSMAGLTHIAVFLGDTPGSKTLTF